MTSLELWARARVDDILDHCEDCTEHFVTHPYIPAAAVRAAMRYHRSLHAALAAYYRWYHGADHPFTLAEAGLM